MTSNALQYKIRVNWTTQGLTNITTFLASTGITDITNDVKTYTVNRGRQTPDDVINAGTCTLTLADTTNKYNVFNSFGPNYGNLLPMRTVYIQISSDLGVTWQDEFFGFIRDITEDELTKQVHVSLIDGFVYLQSVIPVIASTGATTTGACITTILNNSISTAYDSSINTGDSVPDFSTDGTASALSKINDLLTVALGLFFVNKSGMFVYLDRYAAYKSPYNTAQATLVNCVKNINPSITLDNVRNGAHVLRQGGVQQDVVNTASQQIYGRIDEPLITSAYLSSDIQALSLAQYFIAVHKNAIGQTRSVDLPYGFNSTMDTAILTMDIGNHINIQDTTAALNNDYDIVGLTKTATPGSEYVATWVLYTRNVYGSPIVLNQSKLDSTDILVY